MEEHRFCKFCGNQVHIEAIMCPKCGRQIEKIKSNDNSSPQVIVNNNNNVINSGKKCDKWISFVLCLFLGVIGVHKFYEGKTGLGILYIFTLGCLGIGVFIELIVILCQPDPYYV